MIQKVIFTGGLNSDTTPELVPQGVSPFRFNVRIISTNDDSGGAMTSSNGNTIVDNNTPFVLPTGWNKCIGYCEDKLRQKGYAFIYNANDLHSIVEYDSLDLTTPLKYVLVNAPLFDDGVFPLNFKLNFLINNPVVVELDKDNHLLYWTDGYINPDDASDYNEPKKINIERGLLYISSSGTNKEGYILPFNPHWIDRIKEPPPAPTYVWTGLGQQPEWVVGALIGLSTPAPAAPHIFLYDHIVSNPTLNYNAGTYIGTILYTGYYDITVALYPATPVSGTATGKVTIMKNGVTPIYTVDTPVVGVLGASVVINLTGVNSVLLAVTDTLSVFVETLDNALYWGAGEPSYLPPVGFTVSFLGATQRELPPNTVFKKFFQFQNDWGYKDKERSVLSQKSKYVMPKTSGITPTGEDYTIQDNAIIITVWTGSADVEDIQIYGHEIGQVDTDTLSDISLIIKLNKKRLGILNDVTYDYIFLNDANYTPISLDKKNQLMDFVFYHEAGLEVFKNRIADTNGAEGVDAVKIDMRLPLDFNSRVDTNLNSYFPKRTYLKSGGIYEYGIVYYFNGGRLGTTNTTTGGSNETNEGIFGTRLFVPFLTEQGYTNHDMSYVPTAKGWIYNKPPKDATEYSIVRSKNQAISNYIQFWGLTDVSIYNPTNLMRLGMANITGRYKDENPSSLLVYDWTKGDKVRLIATVDASSVSPIGVIQPFMAYNDTEITDTNYADPYEILYPDPAFSPPNIRFPKGTLPSNLCLYEIYTPAKDILNDNELMFEVGERGTIGTDDNGNKIHIPYDNTRLVARPNQRFTSFNSVANWATPLLDLTCIVGQEPVVGDNVKVIGKNGSIPVWSIYGIVTAIGTGTLTVDTIITSQWGTIANNAGEVAKCSEQEFTSGDCFRRECDMPLVFANTPVFRLYSYIETMNASNMFPSEAWDYGRPNRIDNDAKRSINKAMVRYSERILPNTNINGLSTVFDLSFEEYSAQYGGIKRLFYQNERLQAYQELKVLPILVLQQNLQSPEGGGLVSSSAQVLAPQQKIDYYLQDFGIGDHPESFAHYGNNKYFIDVKRSAIVRLSQDGLVDITAEANMSIFMANLCQKILASPTKVNCLGVYDVRFGEYILSVSPFYYGDNIYFEGITIAFNEKANQFATSWGYLPEMMGQTGIDILTFKDGRVWLHNTNPLQSNFYGVQQYAEYWVYLNDSPENMKVIKAIKQRGLIPMSVEVSDNEGQFTHLLDTNFDSIEGNWYSDVFKDEYTPNDVPSPPAPQYLPNAIVEGDDLRSRCFLLKFKHDSPTYNKVFAMELQYILSNPSVK